MSGWQKEDKSSFLIPLARWLAVLVYAYRFLGRHKSIRTLLITLVVGFIGGYLLFGSVVLETTLVLLQVGLQFVFVISMMLVQFVALFWFMSQTKQTIILPDDKKHKSFSFDDYWGQPELVKMVREWIILLSPEAENSTQREAFLKMGGRQLSGILLTGPPGVGKSMLAKCLAGESGIAFVGCEGSGFRGMFWGIDTLRVIQLFGRARSMAKQYGSAIIFIDEIDSIGMSRGGVQGGGQTQVMSPMGGMGGSGALTRLLYEMDGLGEVSEFDLCLNKARAYFHLPAIDPGFTLVTGSTNRPDVLDPALTRKGRFDRIIQVDPPDEAGRRAIISGYLGKVHHADDVDIEILVSNTSHYTPADIASSITKDAPRRAVFAGRDAISQRDIEEAMIEQTVGIAQPISNWDTEQQRQVAWHEAGHALALWLLFPGKKKVSYLTCVRRSNALGFMMPVNVKDIWARPLSDVVRDVMVGLAGHEATKIGMGELWTGATSDFRTVRMYVSQLADLGYFGTVLMGDGKDHVQDAERFITDCMERTNTMLTNHRGKLESLALELIEKKDMTGTEVAAVLSREA